MNLIDEKVTQGIKFFRNYSGALTAKSPSGKKTPRF